MKTSQQLGFMQWLALQSQDYPPVKKKRNHKISEISVVNEDGISSISATVFSIDNWMYNILTKEYQGYILDNRIKQSVLDGGGVQVYVQSANNQFTALPATTYTSPGASYKLVYAVSLQQVKIELQYPDLQQGVFPGLLRFKIVVFSSDFISAHKNVDLKNHDEVKQFIGQ